MMHRLLNILSQAFSVALFPLFMPTYGIILYCFGIRSFILPLPPLYWIIIILGTLVLTAIIPLTTIFIGMRRGVINDIHISDATQRHIPYFYTIISFGFWVYFLHAVVHAPIWLILTASSATLAVAGAMIVNHWWKISAHLTGFGGLIGGIMNFCLSYSVMPTLTFIVILAIIALVLMYARLYLNAHSPLQVVAGLTWGIYITFLPIWIYNLCLPS